MESSACFSPCRTWRYTLWREWSSRRPTLNTICLNPSTADEAQDDPTVRRCIGFAKRLGYGGLSVTNIFSVRTKDGHPRHPLYLRSDTPVVIL